MSRLSIDLKVMPRSQKGHCYILCVIGEMTNYLVTAPIYQAKSEEIGDVLIENVISKFGTPEYIIMDQDNAFMSTLMNYYTLLNKGLHYLKNVLQNFQSKWVALINKDREYFQYNGEDLVYLISPLTSQLRTASRKVSIRHVGPLVIYKIVDTHNYLLMTMDGKLLRGVFEHKRLKPVVLKTDRGNVSTLPALKKVMNLEITQEEMR